MRMSGKGGRRDDLAARGVLLRDGQRVGEGEALRLERGLEALRLDIEARGLAGQVKRAGQHFFGRQSAGYRLLHVAPYLREIVAYIIVLVLAHIFPVAPALAAAEVDDVAHQRVGIDVRVAVLEKLRFVLLERAASDAVDSPCVEQFAAPVIAVYLHGVGMVGQEGVRLPGYLAFYIPLFQRAYQRDVGQVALAGGGEGAVEGDAGLLRAVDCVGEYLSCTRRAHGVARRGAVAYLIYFLYRSHLSLYLYCCSLF